MINCIIVEDELPAREELKYFLNEEKEIKLIAEFDNPLDTLNFLENNTADVIFLDINMPDMNGISLGKIITKMYPDMKIIFITAYKDYAVDSFEIKAFDYLLKMDHLLIQYEHLINFQAFYHQLLPYPLLNNLIANSQIL